MSRGMFDDSADGLSPDRRKLLREAMDLLNASLETRVGESIAAISRTLNDLSDGLGDRFFEEIASRDGQITRMTPQDAPLGTAIRVEIAPNDLVDPEKLFLCFPSQKACDDFRTLIEPGSGDSSMGPLFGNASRLPPGFQLAVYDVVGNDD